MDFKDYYSTMGVARDATQDEIKRAYRKLARKYHPDVSKEPDATERFQELGEAYEVLKDPEKRAAYDQLGSSWRAGEEFRPPPDWDAGFEFRGGGFTGPGAHGFSDFFEELFGRMHAERDSRAAHAVRMRGEDHHARVVVEVEDAYRGATRTIRLRVPEVTEDGHVVARERTLNVHIPKGIRPGQHIRLAGQGGPGIGSGPAGDLYLEVEFRHHGRFRVDGADVHMDVPVAPWEAALGAKVEVMTPSGPVGLTVPPGSQQGRRLRLRGRGLPGREPGDLYAVVQIVLPPADTEAGREAYREMARRFSFDPRAREGD